ncbi:MAG: cell division protein ZipA [Xanthomonadales bacterium]|nr:cell division protein ZipA [Xanthomonadales bacterium]
METLTFRWVLIICGVLLLAGVFLFGNPNKTPKKRATRPKKKTRKAARERKSPMAPRTEPTLSEPETPGGGEGRQEPAFDAGDGATTFDDTQGELPIDAPVDEPAAPAPMAQPEKVVVLYLRARDNRTVSGLELLEAAQKSGMEFGAMDIFHRLVEGERQPVFSMANLEQPGTFSPDSWATLSARGMTLFMGLPGPLSALDAWDATVATARRMAELLHLDVLDDQREHFSRQREGEIREELRAFERGQLPEA